ncbi:MAG: TonB-dependent receptor [Saprospiraceae bacterium]|nr:TonB-dependent receptor [Saprospiraceae bacterium]
MKHIVGLPLLLLVLANAQAQSPLIGRITDAVTGAPLVEAFLHFEEAGRTITTDGEGRFEVIGLAAGAHTVSLFAEGYATRQEIIKVPDTISSYYFTLQSLEYDMRVVEVAAVSNSGGWRRLRNVEGMAIYAAKKNEVIELSGVMGNLAANNAREIYKSIAGLNIWESDGAGLQLAIGARGLDPNRTSSFNTRQNGYDISADALGYPESYYTPPTQALERIEIVRGAASLQYGPQFGGLLNFVMKKGPRDKKIAYSTDNTYGAFGFLSSTHSLGGTVGKLNYYTFYQYRQAEGWRANSEFGQHTGFANLDFTINEKLNLGLEVTAMHYLAQQPGGLTDFEFEADPRLSKRARNWFAVDWKLAALTLNYRFSDATKLNIRNFALMAGRDALGELGPINRPDPLRERDLVAGRYRNFGSEARIIHRYDLGGFTSTLLTGLRYYQGFTHNRQGNADNSAEPRFEFLNPLDLEKSEYRFPSRNLAFFAENLFNLSNRWSLTPGLRIEYIRTAAEGYFKQRIFSGNQLIFERRYDDTRLQERGFILLGLGTGYRTGAQTELYANISQNYRAINFSDLAVVNPNLLVDSLMKDERGYNADLGWRGNFMDDRIRFDVSAFYLLYRGRIGLGEKEVTTYFSDSIPLTSTVAYRTNIGDARIVGLEAYAEANVWRLLDNRAEAPSLVVFLNGSVLQGRYLSGLPSAVGKEVELIPPLNLKTGVSFQYKGWRAGFQYSYTHRHYSDATNAVFVADATRGIIPSYGVADLSAAYTWKKYILSTGINNLMDAVYFTRRATAYPGPGIIPAEGRRWYVGVRVMF